MKKGKFQRAAQEVQIPKVTLNDSSHIMDSSFITFIISTGTFSYYAFFEINSILTSPNISCAIYPPQYEQRILVVVVLFGFVVVVVGGFSKLLQSILFTASTKQCKFTRVNTKASMSK